MILRMIVSFIVSVRVAVPLTIMPVAVQVSQVTSLQKWFIYQDLTRGSRGCYVVCFIEHVDAFYKFRHNVQIMRGHNQCAPMFMKFEYHIE